MEEPAAKRMKQEQLPALQPGGSPPKADEAQPRGPQKGMTEDDLLLRFREACRLNGHSMEDVLSRAGGGASEPAATVPPGSDEVAETLKDGPTLAADGWACDGGLPADVDGLEPGVRARIAELEAANPEIGVEYFPYEPHGLQPVASGTFFDTVEEKWLTAMEKISWHDNKFKQKLEVFSNGDLLLWSDEVRLHPLYSVWARAVHRNVEGKEDWHFANHPSEIVCFHIYCHVYMEELELLALAEETDPETLPGEVAEPPKENDVSLKEAQERERNERFARECDADLRLEYFGSDIDSDDGMELSPLKKKHAQGREGAEGQGCGSKSFSSTTRADLDVGAAGERFRGIGCF